MRKPEYFNFVKLACPGVVLQKLVASGYIAWRRDRLRSLEQVPDEALYTVAQHDL
jgi:hypothetical protein